MSRRTPKVTQAEIARALRAIIAVGLKVSRIVAKADTVEIETTESGEAAAFSGQRKRIVL